MLKIFCGDCIEIIPKEIESNSIDLIVTSPPYNLNMKYDNYNDDLSWKEYFLWTERWLKVCYRVLKPDGRICINHYLSCGTAAERVAPLMTINELAIKNGFHHHGLAIWDDRTLSKWTAWGSWLSASAPYINSPYEGILILYKDQWKKQNKGRTEITKEEFMESCSGIWKIAPEKNRSVCPAPFPVALPSRCIRLLSYEGDTVLDPFMGYGSTGVAAIENNRNFIGIDLSKFYCDSAKERMMLCG